MKIIMEDNDLKVSVESSEVECSAILEQFLGLLVAMGFHPDSVKRAVICQSEEYENDNKEV